ncbi:hypothetical protein IV203_010452 [Nitzschia inconspicua]|uniref:Uncharacterized protein n=1 Tax=Nitzschia inconspicua TaxID=303405 RepID=A0A9K3KWB1_9STRA|nr:hypothetical protein IV203_010452 [Nitzschia inconspicua]
MKLFSLLCILASAEAFSTAPVVRARAPALSLMSQDETNAVLNKAEDCVSGECSIDQIDDLVDLLKEQQKELRDRLSQVNQMVETLEKVNKHPDGRPVDEIRETVRAIFRVFQMGDKASGNDYPSLSKPTGWSGEVGKGPTTAYDALPPKKMKKATP